MKIRNQTNSLALSAMFMALAYTLPFLTGQIPEINAVFCPMHIPVLLCGYVCGAPWGVFVGFVTPLFRSFTMGLPVLFPKAVSMAFELAVYGFLTGFLYRVFPKKKGYIYCSLLISMVAGRLVSGFVQFACLGFDTAKFGFSVFFAGAVTNALPAIVIQIVLIPILVIIMEKAKLIANKP